jgi:hypothetical protein
MTVIAKRAKKKQFEIPDEGPCQAKLAEVRDLGEVQTGAYGSKPKVLFVWETDALDSKGNSMKVFERFTNTLHPMGRLAPRLKSITGELPDQDADLDLTALEGTQAQLIIEHNVTEDGTYANIAAIVRQKTEKEAAEEARVRKAESAIKQRNSVVAAGVPKAEIADSDVPF